ncbi:MAG: hypothetical protein BWY78_01360 [Alphaproteobacteria bacterium ADurb.Bin438]|nr:MAG: hypothetical protein BWY78_01360 [Alphaproteobacteria bacterium ADurb.Bin438]
MFKYILIFLIFFSSSVFSKTIDLEYDVYAGGLRGLNAKITITLKNDNTYEISSIAKTTGFIGTLYYAMMKYDTFGEIKENYFKTSNYIYNAETRKKKRTKNIDFSEYKDYVDYQTVFLNIISHITKNDNCDLSNNVYSGKRFFKIDFKNTENLNIKDKGKGIYQGEAIACNVDIESTGQKDYGWFFDQSQGELKAYFAKIPNLDNKIMVKADMGTLGHGNIIAYLVKAEIKEN